jgi:hypothetical protein
MGIVFEEETRPAVAVSSRKSTETTEPSYGAAQVTALKEMIEAAKLAPHSYRQHMYDCINVRYRSKAYRDHIKHLIPSHMSQNQVSEMKRQLSSIRHASRTPRAKAFRFEWP